MSKSGFNPLPPPRNRAVSRWDDETENAFATDDALEEPLDSGPGLRLRHLLILVLFGAAAWWAYPRALSAWSLYDQANKLADYALCMGGPTGPSLIRDNPAEFKKLVRRRLLAARAQDRLFENCAPLAGALTKSQEVERIHLTPAWTFKEYGLAAGGKAEAGERVQLDDLKVSVKPLAKLMKEGWPFARGGYSRLIKPSSTAYTAPHPGELSLPAAGSGLPAWRVQYRAVKENAPGDYSLALGASANLSVFRSQDGGVTWKSIPKTDASVADVAERCPAGEGRSFIIGLDDEAKYWQVTSRVASEDVFISRVALATDPLVSAACDEGGLVVATRKPKSAETHAAFCEFRGNCRALQLPDIGPAGQKPRFPMDFVRVKGATVLAVTRQGIVRVTSSRDDGKTWTPFTVAFDQESNAIATSVKVPSRLLAAGDSILLYGGASKAGATYPVLVSKDLGASFGAP